MTECQRRIQIFLDTRHNCGIRSCIEIYSYLLALYNLMNKGNYDQRQLMQNTYCPKITLNFNLLFFIDRCDFNKAKCKVPDLEKIGLSDCKSTGVTRAFIEKFKRRRNRTKGSGK